jgi:hypothetical protein
MRGMGCLRGALAALVVAAPAIAELPSGTIIEVRLLTPVSSYSSRAGTEIRASVLGAVCQQSGVPFPAGTVVSGIVKAIRRVGLGLVRETARMELDFRDLHLQDGRDYPLQARLIRIDNARERVDRAGAIRGARATDSLSNRLSMRIASEALVHPIGLIPLFVLENTMFRFPNPEIEYTSGTELVLELENPVGGDISGCPTAEPVVHADESDELQHLIAALPYWTYCQRNRKPMDPTNLVFVGSQEEIERGFAAAGWNGSQPASASTRLEGLRAMMDRRGYDDAPMTTLLLDGAEPDINRQKALNTLGKRDHLRIWKRDGEWRGRTVWASAATKDVAATFSFQPFGFSHQIQNDIDLERDKVVTDLEFTGCVDSVSYVERPEVLRSPEYEERKGVVTDARIAIVELNSCDTPVPAAETEGENPPPPVAFRIFRRLMLTARNHIIRDNLIWRRGEAVYVGFRMLRNWRAQHMSEQRAHRIMIEHAHSDRPPGNSGGDSVAN